MWRVQVDGKVVREKKARLPGVQVESPREGWAVLLLVENSPRHEDGDLLSARERIRQVGGYRRRVGYARNPLEVAKELLARDRKVSHSQWTGTGRGKEAVCGS